MSTEIQWCNECSRTFKNPRCLAMHKQLRNNERTHCNQLFICEDCGVFVSLLRSKERDWTHKYGKIYCQMFEACVQQATHLCYLNNLNPDPIAKDLPRHIYCAFETWVKPGNSHTPNLVIAQYADKRSFVFLRTANQGWMTVQLRKNSELGYFPNSTEETL